ncbi:phosphopentomutase [Stutzerimonas kirkiae]|uniref:Phosphopentomutase n=1 Tax=Stutzerimonas kirkiae TaxID=2211392 RepID=A0A4Q9R704_9GAMM|nr:phosphopentomutase [Stutzerimonas kirkiae]TBU95784.1 phosphopentomutase [Stutzerimonas kirkiae]TBV02775.1 phosphopentomutase [Stutzerimonas kirkiae]TBV03731.1 phosphopentomutase [Stutzerimonas kirkiae]TBV13288.1 phosphopentomutase [Stutzerimonas kirkiae]
MKRALLLVLDSFGIGASADAGRFGDAGANTLLHIAQACAHGAADTASRQGPLALPNLARLGLGHAAALSGGEFPPGFQAGIKVEGAYGYARELSSGKDTPSGHWEMAGVPVLFDWGYFADRENSFPAELLDSLIKRGGLPGILGNCHASGTTIIEQLGDEHVRSGKPILYTSADSVLQIAAHEEHFGLERLLALCELARELCDPYNIGRVIARPFLGDGPATYARTGNRRDYAVPPPAPTLLERLCASGGQVHAVGKIGDIFAHQGISRLYKANGNEALFDATLQALRDAPTNTLVFSNFVDFDMLYGHRRDIAGYAAALEAFDRRLPELLAQMRPGDLLLLAADHGCDPSAAGSDHTREHIPVLAWGNGVRAGSLGERETFADIGQTLADFFGLPPCSHGRSFLSTASTGDA